MKKYRLILLISVLLVTTLGCGLSKAAIDTAPGSGPETEVETETETEGGLEGLLPDIGKKDVNSEPVTLNKGLSTLDSYRMTLEIELIGPSQQDINREKVIQENSKFQDASFFVIETYSMNSEDYEEDTNKSYIWRIGNDRCQGTDDPEDDFSWESMEPDAKEMADLVLDLFDLDFMIENPQFVAEESMNGIQTNHFRFQLSGLGVESGATVLANQGEYWLAVDGNYMVRYSLLVETSSSPEKINHLKVYANLEEVNVPRTISMPQQCYDAQYNTEE